MVKHSKLLNCKVVPSREDILVTLPQESVCAEIGISSGKFTSSIIKVVNPSELYLVDIDINCINKCKKKFLEKDNLKFFHGNSNIILKEFEDNYFDWIFLDTDHTHLTTKVELEQASRIVKDDGMIIVHDYIPYSYLTKKPYGVIPAVNEFVNNSDWEFKYITLEPSMYIAVALTKNTNGESFRRII